MRQPLLTQRGIDYHVMHVTDCKAWRDAGHRAHLAG